jgi:ABC-2 type transport system ATP-binding protein
MNNVIETIDLTRRFRRADAVDRLTLQVPVGSIFALVGPNGAGKTTTIKLLMNLIRPSRGSAFVLGTDSRQLGPEQFRRIGYVSENQRLPDWMTPDQLLAYVKPFYPTWDEGLCQKLRADLGLTAAAPLRTLSRGTRMKAALLSSLAYRPELVVLDEPFTGLDPLVRDQLIHALLELTGEQPLSVLVSSHDIEEIERLADWIGYIDAGRLIFSEPVASLLKRFRLIEVVSTNGRVPVPPQRPEWLVHGLSGRTLRFVDTRHDEEDAAARIATEFPNTDIRVSELSLREIFIALARQSGTTAAVQAEAV